ncbi:hypothetical protein N9C66_06305 [Akkermansiaceae bacterium]|nr:hypothetical protein [Akkermansiaceae bacterium]
MKTLIVAAAFVHLVAFPATADEPAYAVCCIDHVVETSTEPAASGVGENLLRGREALRTTALAIVRRLAAVRGYDYVFNTERTRAELIAENSPQGLLIDFSCPDISDEVSRLLKEQIQAEQAGAGQPATRPESKSEEGDKPQPESEGRSR